MALLTKISKAASSVAMDAMGALLDGGYLRIYNGSQPTDADTAIGAQVLLAELRFPTPAFAAAADGVLTAGTMVGEDLVLAIGTAAWCRCLASDGTTVIMDGTVGTGTHNVVVTTTTFTTVTSDTVDITALTFTLPRTGA